MNIRFTFIVVVSTLLLAVPDVIAQVDGSLPLNHSVSGELTGDDATDIWIIVIDTDGVLELNTTSEDLHVYSGLMDSENRSINAREIKTPPDTAEGVRYSKFTICAGTYYIKVSRSTSDDMPYTLSNTFNAAGYDPDIERNDDWDDAIELRQDYSSTGHLGFCYEGHASIEDDKYDVDDWWYIETNADGVLEIGVEVIGSGLVAQIHLYDSELNGIKSSYPDGLDDAIHSLTYPVVEGFYFVQILRPQGNPYEAGYGSYSIYNELTPAAFPNDLEPNDSGDDALSLDPDDSATGHLGYCIRGDYDPLVVKYEFDTCDYWKVVTPTEGVLAIATESTDLLKTDINIYDENMIGVVGNYENGTENEASYHITAGTYFVQISRHSSGQYGSYLLTSSFDAAPYDNDSEPNDDWDTAAPLVQHGSDTGHLGYCTRGRIDFASPHQYDANDYWRIKTGSDGLLDIAVTGEGMLEFSFTVYDDEHRGVFSDYSDETLHATNSYAIAEDVYWLKIHRDNTDNYGAYTITNTFTSTSLVNDPEPNDDAENAYTILFNDSDTGHLGYCTRGRYDAFSSWQYDTTDWWQFSVAQPESLHVVAVSVEDTLAVSLVLYDGDLNSLKGSSASGDSSIIIYPDAEAGYYFVKASRKSYTKGFGSYFLSINHSFVPVYPPENVSIAPEGDTVRLLWDPPAAGSIANGYNIYRSRNLQFTQPVSHEIYESIEDLLTAEETSTIHIGSVEPEITEFLDPYKRAAGSLYRYWVKTVGDDGESESEAVVVDNVVYVAEEHTQSFRVDHPFPNPFNPSTTISFAFPEQCRVEINIYAANGQLIDTPLNDTMNAGMHYFMFNGAGLPSGLYFFKVHANGVSRTVKALLVR